jgi:hypothetical protein
MNFTSQTSYWSNDNNITVLIIYSYKSKNCLLSPVVGTKFANNFAGNYFALLIIQHQISINAFSANLAGRHKQADGPNAPSVLCQSTLL